MLSDFPSLYRDSNGTTMCQILSTKTTNTHFKRLSCFQAISGKISLSLPLQLTPNLVPATVETKPSGWNLSPSD